MNEIETTLLDIFEHIETHGNHLVNYDKPKELRIGYLCAKTQREWYLRLSSLKQYISKDDFLHKTFMSNIFSKEGKLELIKILQKAYKLKAFW